MTQAEEKEYKEQVAVASARSLYLFVKNFWHTINNDKFVDNWHIFYVCNQLERYGHQVITQGYWLPDMIINVPPGSSKSTMVSQMFNAWLWLHAPWAVIISSTHTQDLTNDHIKKTKLIIQSDQFQEFYNSGYFKGRYGKALSFIKENERDLQNNFGGRRYGTSTRGTITGLHAHVILRDDPISAEKATSPTYREQANRFNDQELASRKKDKDLTPTITVMQRVHEEDTTGWELDKPDKEIFHVCLPAELSDDIRPASAAEHYTDGLMDPRRMSRSALKKQRVDLGSYAYSGQYQQTPFPEEGGIIKRDWFLEIDDTEVPGDTTWDLWIDGAYTESTKNDPSGLMVMGYSDRTRKTYIGHAESAYMELPKLIDRVVALCKEWNINAGYGGRVYIEPKASGESLRQMLIQMTHLDVYKIAGKLVAQGKTARVNTVSPKLEAGRIIMVRASWNKEVKDQLCFFPNMKHDEYCDLSGYATFEYYIRRDTEFEVEVS